ncbi:hypothetical protein P153DRAFT_206463 [Dothidotthia symphoricarpi CBS 119687]|uniref:Uncharacterized protein n=1 Tax=Dothidotthia symphoricarpi CBS 119687 TaxID=1392245 RepID=A0A6A6AKD5_9PLEO|nr:uncharacterized protein P153DRAFT_206463 [Dothidotthia symphoricarpi CBS 119687]KAF2130901.1 hypothetical protein P153DRAFT_206463 [Dothidotthia symphoricarpi CBS 119687]
MPVSLLCCRLLRRASWQTVLVETHDNIAGLMGPSDMTTAPRPPRPCMVSIAAEGARFRLFSVLFTLLSLCCSPEGPHEPRELLAPRVVVVRQSNPHGQCIPSAPVWCCEDLVRLDEQLISCIIGAFLFRPPLSRNQYGDNSGCTVKLRS